jgi:hypothetical protein
MDNNLQAKIYDVLLSIEGLTQDNVFYIKSDVNSKIFPRYVFSSIVDVSEYDTIDRFDEEEFQVSLFGEFQYQKIIELKNKAKLIENNMTRINLSGTGTQKISRCRLSNYRESELDKIFQIDLTFKLNSTREK